MWNARLFSGLLIVGALMAGCGDDGDFSALTSPRDERVKQVQLALSPVLTEQAALVEAERLVSLCEDSPEDMMVESIVWDPDGPELFESLDDAAASGIELVAPIQVAALACTPSDFYDMNRSE